MSDAAALSPRRVNYALGLLVFLYVINYIDRQVLSVLLEPIKRELGASDTAMGFLSGLAFALFYTTAGVPIARFADGGNRRNVIVLGVFVWSAMTALSGLAKSFAQLALARVGVGVGEAALSPAAHSLISDYFPVERRATALAIYNVGGNVGVMIGFIAGGWIGEAMGWRTAFFVVGLPGLLAAVLAYLTLPEPRSRSVSGEPTPATPVSIASGAIGLDESAPTIREVARYMFSHPTFRHVSLACAFYVFAAFGCTTWGATFLIRVHHLSLAETGWWMGLVQGIGGGLGTFVGGYLADRLARRDQRMLVLIPAFGGLLAIPFLAVFLFAPTPALAIAGYGPAMALSVFFVGPSYAVVQGIARPRMRAQAAALVMLTMNLIGLGIAPLVIGMLNDALLDRFGDEAVRYSLVLCGATSLWAVLHSLWAARTVRADLAANPTDRSTNGR